MGRPLVSDAPTVAKAIRFSPKEWAVIDAEAERRGITRAAFLRELLREVGLLPERGAA